ncbi:hypothetical protein AGABI1DRAFT_79978 [Agaricus bisporus var. burnettii JB137-S8]|uniref:WSC domain-containing protein n=1 Tax=Agaricus bisporus var. burnettii (strain JB137-S8 / ATCC MYA-4627 / FGSC 10392) TaxID=597362 RepID=K5VLU3_AGABU|nr:uncharacterized protein AGABI1DRAFT_79978 [Agaricus bisporus var. burnettii JB137-S8]EKM75389.1 hypothetical protein AGABI1DRAFT_79978 [Agaricus bisporus var. burnettii JB137-S8]
MRISYQDHQIQPYSLAAAIPNMFSCTTYDYTIDDWKSDIQEIGSGGVDAIALNFGSNYWENEQLHNAYDAGSGSGVKLFLSFDFSVFPCDVNSVVNVVNQFAQHESQFKVDGRPLISSFLGACLGSQGWQEIKDRTGGYLMPFIEGIEGQFDNWNCLDSWYCWGCAWPQGDVNKTTADDRYYISQIGSSTKYAATISPWIFTHYDYKNFYQRGDDWLIVSRWEQLIEMRDQLPMVEMVTWNDFGESSYFGHVKGVQPSGTTWADGYSHLPFFELSKYYITAFKTGHYPAINQDVIYFWARPHPAEAAASVDALARPQGYNFAEDSLWALAFATQSGQVTLTCGISTQQFTVKPGINKLKLPLSPGQITVSMSRDGKRIINKSPSDFTYNSSPDLYNYNVYVGRSATHLSSMYSTGALPTPSSTITSTSQVLTTPTLSRTTSSYGWESLGCYIDSTDRLLKGFFTIKPGMTAATCVAECSDHGFIYAATEYGIECHCGNNIESHDSGVSVDGSQCNMACDGDPSTQCGGSWRANVYRISAKSSRSLVSQKHHVSRKKKHH